MRALTDAYPASYHEARERFRRQARALGWSLASHSLPSATAGGEALSIDWAATGADDPGRTLMISSGLHGIEGFFGSAVQLAALESIFPDWTVPPGLRVVCVHALNPYGFAERRRFDEQNIDPNRNFKLPHEEYAGCPEEYRRLNDWLNPPSAPGAIDLFRWQAGVVILRYGLPALRQAIAGGQHEYPQGLFFGGHGPSPVFQNYEALWAQWTRKAPRVLHLDIHTGLGRSGEYKLLLDTAIDDDEMEWLSGAFGAEQLSECGGGEVAYQSVGSLGHWCRATYPGRYVYLCAEFGTFGPLKVLAALRAENRAHHFASSSSPALRRAKERLLNAFCPHSRRWRERALRNGLALVRQACGALAETS
jgi:hypothetical protein